MLSADKRFPVLVCIFLLTITFFSSVLVSIKPVVGQDANKLDHVAELKKVHHYIAPLLKHPLVMKLNGDIAAWHFGEYNRTLLPDENKAHEEGIFWMKDITAYIFGEHPPRFSVGGTSNVRVLRGHLPLINKEKVKEDALAFLKVAFPWFFDSQQMKDLQAPELYVQEPEAGGLWRLEWKRLDQSELPRVEVGASVRAIDGKIVSFGASRLNIEWKHKIKFSEAKRKVLAEINKGAQFKNIEIVNWDVTSGGGARSYFFTLQLEDRETGQLLRDYAEVDAITGEISFSFEPRQPIGSTHDASMIVEDQLPTWTEQGLAFVSDRHLAGMPSWAVMPPQLLLQNTKGGLSYLTSDMKQSIPSQITGMSSGSWLNLEARNWTYAFDLKTGSYRVLGHPDRLAQSTTTNSDGTWAIISGTGHTGNADLDLMADKLERDPKLGLRGRLVMPGGDEFLPLFSPDGQWVYFVTATETKEGRSFKLQRLAAKDALTKDLKRVKPEQVQNIATLSEEVERISFFPDGKRVLLQNRKGMFVVSVPEGKVTPVAPKDPKDAEVGAPITQTRDGWAGPGNERVTFSGQMTDQAGKVRWRIYSVKLDGSDLKAHTPKENEPVPMYKFPDSDKTAYDLAKAWALGEIEWEDKNSRR